MEIQQIELEQLTPWDRNPRKNEHAVDAVAESIRQFGFNVPIVCDQDYQVVAGHVRLKAAKKLELTEVPVVQLHLTAAERDAFAVADNKTGELADWDTNALSSIIEELDSLNIDISSLGFHDAELHALLEPEEDFDFGQFEEELILRVERDHAFLPVKVPIHVKEEMKLAIKNYASGHGISEGNEARLAGKVIASLLEMPSWTKS